MRIIFLLYLTDPVSSIPKLKEMISVYGYISGYKINVDKTEAMDVNSNIPLEVKQQSSFRWSKEGIKYLGISIPLSLNDLFHANYGKTLDIIKKDLERWSALPLSFLGRIETIRMNLLPRLLYLFQMLPIVVPKSTFTDLDKTISKFIWQSKRPRIKYKTLQRSKGEGGLNLPVLKYYFWAAQLKPLISWIQGDFQTRWLSIEQTTCSEPLNVLPFLDIPIKELSLWTRTTLNIWNKVRVAFKLPRGLSILTSIGYIKSFAPNSFDKSYSKWAEEQRLTFLHQLINRNNLMSFEELRRHFHLKKSDFFRYLQLRSFLTSHKDWGKILNPTPIENTLIQFQKGEGDKKLITKLYKVFLSMNLNGPTRTKQRWEAETDKIISDEMWEGAWTGAHRVTSSNTWREYKWKVISRYFRTPDVVAKIDPKVPSLCWRNCGSAVPNHTHIFWSCPILQNYWDEVYKAINQIFQEDIPKDATVALLGIMPVSVQGHAKSYLLNILFTAALKCITIKWMQVEPPCYNVWVQKVRELYQMEKITYSLRLQKSVFSLRWSPAEVLFM